MLLEVLIKYWSEIRKESVKKYLRAGKRMAKRWLKQIHLSCRAIPLRIGVLKILKMHSQAPLVFVSDEWIPEYNKNAGARCTFDYLKLMAEMGMRVIFYPRDKRIRSPYSRELIDSGIKILIPVSIESWLSRWGNRIDAFYLHRPSSSGIVDFICMYKKGSANITYFAHDIHHIRLRRQFNIEKNITVLREAALVEYSERKMFELADTIHVVGSFEKSYLQRQYTDKKIEEIPLYFYNISETANYEFDIESRSDLIFVGGFRHSPNLDAMEWFLSQVWPGINIRLPNVYLHIVGSDIPDSFGNEDRVSNLIKHGQVSDNVLYDLYKRTRLMIAPLRYGAGVKGKIIEAMYWKLPVMTSSVGAEGIISDNRIFKIADSAADWVDGLAGIYSDVARLGQMAEYGYQYIIENNSRQAAERLMERCLKE